MKRCLIFCAIACAIVVLDFWSPSCDKGSLIEGDTAIADNADVEEEMRKLYSEWEAELESERQRRGIGLTYGAQYVFQLPCYTSLILAPFNDVEWSKFVARKLQYEDNRIQRIKNFYLACGVCKRFGWNKNELLESARPENSRIPDVKVFNDLVLHRIDRMILQPQQEGQGRGMK